MGDVRGVLEIIRPLDADIIRIRNRLSETFIYMVAVSITLIGLTLIFLRIGRRH